MSRLVFFLLLIANVALGAHIYLDETRPKTASPREVNPGTLKIVSVTDATKARQDALNAKKLAASLSGSACVDFAVKPVDGVRAQAAFAAMNLGSRVSSRNVEEFSRFSVTLPPQKDKRAVDALVASLKKAGVKDVSAFGDNAISLGLFSSDEAAQKLVSDLKAKAQSLVKDVQVNPRNPQLKETLFTLREPDTNMVARLTLMQREFGSSSLRAVTCPAAVPVAADLPVETGKSARK